MNISINTMPASDNVQTANTPATPTIVADHGNNAFIIRVDDRHTHAADLPASNSVWNELHLNPEAPNAAALRTSLQEKFLANPQILSLFSNEEQGATKSVIASNALTSGSATDAMAILMLLMQMLNELKDGNWQAFLQSLDRTKERLAAMLENMNTEAKKQNSATKYQGWIDVAFSSLQLIGGAIALAKMGSLAKETHNLVQQERALQANGEGIASMTKKTEDLVGKGQDIAKSLAASNPAMAQPGTALNNNKHALDQAAVDAKALADNGARVNAEINSPTFARYYEREFLKLKGEGDIVHQASQSVTTFGNLGKPIGSLAAANDTLEAQNARTGKDEQEQRMQLEGAGRGMTNQFIENLMQSIASLIQAYQTSGTNQSEAAKRAASA